MGYYTQFRVTATTSDGTDVTNTYLGPISLKAKYHPDQLVGGDTIKWYGCVADMLDISAQFPDIEFRVRGDGDEEGDIWVAWFKGGKVQTWRLPAPEVPLLPLTPWEDAA